MTKKAKKYTKDDIETIIQYYVNVIGFFGLDYVNCRIKQYMLKPKDKQVAYRINKQYFFISNSDQLEFHCEAVRRFNLKIQNGDK